MDYFIKAADAVKTVGKDVVDKTKETTEIFKLKSSIKSDENEIAKQMYYIGVKYYEDNKEVFDLEYEKYFNAIERLEESIKNKKEQLDQI